MPFLWNALSYDIPFLWYAWSIEYIYFDFALSLTIWIRQYYCVPLSFAPSLHFYNALIHHKNCHHAIFLTRQFKLINSHINNFWFEEKSYKSLEQIIDLGELKTTLHAHSFQALMFEWLLKMAISMLSTATVWFTGCSEKNENVHVVKLQGLEQKAAMFVCTVNSTNKRQAWGLTHFLKSQTERLL